MTNPDTNVNDNGNNTGINKNDNSNDSNSQRKERKPKKKKTVTLSSSKEYNSNAATAAAAAAAATGGTSSAHGSRKKSTTSRGKVSSKSSHRQGGSSKSKEAEKQYKKTSMLQFPHVKVTIRNIQGADKYGNVQNVINLLRELINDRNQNKYEIVSLMSADGSWGSNEDSLMIAKVLTPRDVVLDETSIHVILNRGGGRMGKNNNDEKDSNKGDCDDVAAAANDDDDKDKTYQDSNGEPFAMKQDACEKSSIEKEVVHVDSIMKDDGLENNATTTETHDDTAGTLEKKNCTSSSRDPNTILAKILYVVPAKKSTRRGELPGHCYLVLYPPVPTFYQEKLKIFSSEKVEEKSQGALGVQNEDAGSDTITKQETKTEQEITTMKEKNCEDVVDNISGVHHVITAPTITAADKSKALAQSRLLLSETISSLAYLCRDESKKDRKYSGIQIEMSPNQKIWKMEDGSSTGGHGIRGGKKKVGMAKKNDSTLEQNEDFLKFIEEKRRKEEELASRPKPPPGGDTLNMGVNREASGAMDNSSNIGDERISAILLHLREKKAAAKKAKKKKEKKDKKKVKSASGSSEKVDTANKNVQGGKKVDKKRKKKKMKQGSAPRSVQSDAKAPPKMLRKI